MLYCSCGYSCGIQAALARHVDKFAGTELAEEHSPSLEAPELTQGFCDDESPSTCCGRSPSSFSLATQPTRPGWRQLAELDDLSPTSLRDPPAEFPRTPSSSSSVSVRILLIRHAQSANKSRASGQASVPDPGLSEKGLEQAEVLGQRLLEEFRSVEPSTVTFVSSPMRRCLQTIQPGIRLLEPPSPEHVLCYGAGYEFGCAGTVNPGSSPSQIHQDFPEFQPVGFSNQSTWDYQGSSPKETEAECRVRGAQIVQWLLSTAESRGREAQSQGQSDQPVHTLVFCTHQTLNDLLCSILIEGSDARWNYGDLRYKLQNAGITEIRVDARGRGDFGVLNDGTHLQHLR
mmetsp:Transcript_96056/g.173306  ORF Transcript_96056/g.173306 Transcript_96056/m.173306 type:complete len:345 (+) Transcript_96056:121-1155(+)